MYKNLKIIIIILLGLVFFSGCIEQSSTTPTDQNLSVNKNSIPSEDNTQNNTEPIPISTWYPKQDTPTIPTTPVVPASFLSETILAKYDFNTTTQNWGIFSSGACLVSLEDTIVKSSPKSLKVTTRAHTYDGAMVPIDSLLEANTTYVIRGFLKRGGGNNDTYILNAKIGASTYRQLNRVLVDDDNWTKFRSFVRFTQSEIDAGIKIYLNSQNYKDDYYLDEIEIVSSNYEPPTVMSSQILKINGNRIVNENNETVNLKGINIIGYSDEDGATNDTTANTFMNYSYYNYDKEDFIALKELGFNSLRLSLWYRTFEDESNPNVWKESGFAWLDTLVGWAKEAGIGIVLDMHAPQGGGFQGPDNVTPFWGDSSYTLTSHQIRFINLWKAIATRYKNEPTILAYDLLNEPCANTQTEYLTLLNNTIDAVRTIDTNHIINVEVDFSANNYEPFELAGESNILYDFHFYDPWDGFTDNDTAIYGTSVTKPQVQTLFDDLAHFYTSRNLPFQLSEFGQKYETFGAKNSLSWVSDVIDMINATSGNYHYFSFKGNEFGLYENNNNFSNNSPVNEPLLELFRDKQ